MKPARFGYHAPASVVEALDVLARTGGKVLAGGQSLIPILNMRLAEPADLIDINRIAELSYVHAEDGGIRVGALARHSDVEHDDQSATRLPLLSQALRLVAHPVIRNRGTVVGSLVHADPAAELPAVLALLGGSVTVARRNGESRAVGAGELFVGPLESAVAPGELAVSAYFPVPTGRVGTDVAEISRRHGDFALAGLVTLVMVGTGGAVEQARAACFGVGPVPVVVDVSDTVAGLGPDAGDGWAAAADRVQSAVEPDDDIHGTAAYRRHLIGVLAARSFRTAWSAALAGSPASAAPGPATARMPSAVGTETGTASRTAGEGAHRSPAPSNTSSERPSQTVQVGPGEHIDVTVTVNGARRTARVEARRLLSDFLRHDLGLTGTHVGCEHGVCGCCSVLLDGRPVRSCLMLAATAEGRGVTTVEGLANPDGTLGPVQQAFMDCHGLQCGFCTPGFLTTVTAFLADNPAPTDDQILEGISGNLCRCTGYQNIRASVRRAAELIAAGQRGGQR